ncbi:hypothetical protein JW968_05225 [Candidatus Woesearchaeota archaeon]|nr:hypothetical protein [Candidatus Woesearchaeota archaeon]
MTLWVPWEIVKIEGGVAHLRRGEYKSRARLVESGFNVGDFVRIQGGLVVGRVSDSENRETKVFWKRFL